MNEVTQTTVTEIKMLHERVTVAMRGVLDDAIRIGELLTAMKSELPHGSFEAWTQENLPFTTRTARNYMRVFREREWLKTESVSDLTGAYKLLAAPESDTEQKIEKLQSDLDNVDSIKNEQERLKEYIRIRNEAAELEQKAAEDRIRAERDAGKLLNEMGKAKYLIDLLTTEWCELTPVGLQKKHESTKEEWLDYGKRLKRADTLLKDFQTIDGGMTDGEALRAMKGET